MAAYLSSSCACKALNGTNPRTRANRDSKRRRLRMFIVLRRVTFSRRTRQAGLSFRKFLQKTNLDSRFRPSACRPIDCHQTVLAFRGFSEIDSVIGMAVERLTFPMHLLPAARHQRGPTTG